MYVEYMINIFTMYLIQYSGYKYVYMLNMSVKQTFF